MSCCLSIGLYFVFPLHRLCFFMKKYKIKQNRKTLLLLLSGDVLLFIGLQFMFPLCVGCLSF